MKISVIIPTYKPKEYIWRCLDSLRNQSFPKTDYEILIVLNGCNEPYTSNIRKYLHDNFANFHALLFQIDQPGVSNARNFALEKSKGEYIVFVDDDDYVSSNFLTNLWAKANDNCIVVSNFKSFIDGCDNIFIPDYASFSISTTQKKDVFRRRSFLSSSCGKLINKGIIRDIKFDISLKNSEDALFMFSISDKIRYIEFADINTFYYRRVRTDSASKKKVTLITKVRDILLLVIKFTLIYVKNPFKYNTLLYISRICAAIYYHLFLR